jgi:lactate permease
MNYLLAFFPILVILILMIFFRWGGQRAGPLGWLVGILIAALAFGLTPQVWWVSQARGLLLAVYVLAVLWPALFLYHIVNQFGGVQAIAQGLHRTIKERGLLLVILAWAFSGLLEGLAGFGLPVAVVAPMLVSLDVAPVVAVAAVATGHAWSVTFGDMGVIFQTLIGVSQVDTQQLVGPAALILGLVCLICGLCTARILGQGKTWFKVTCIAMVMAAVQYGLAVAGLIPISALGAGVMGVLTGIILSRRKDHAGTIWTPALRKAAASYGSLAVLMTILALPGPVRASVENIFWKPVFPQVVTMTGFVTPAGPGQTFRLLLHPGTSILLVAILSFFLFNRFSSLKPENLKKAALATWTSAAPASIGIITIVCLALLMDHCGMTMLLAQGLSATMQSLYPLVSPMVGILGAFATGSNNNSNVLFAVLQKNAALILGLNPLWLLAAQTAGGALGSMIAPAKIIVGCSTVGLKGKDGDVLRITLPYGLLIGLGIGVIVFLVTR